MKIIARTAIARRVAAVLIIMLVLWLNVSNDDFKSQVADTWTYIRGTHPPSSDIACYDEYLDGSIPEMSYEDTAGLNGRTIFFHETSCFSNASTSFLTARQACAVESAALAHPNHTVFLLYTAPVRWFDTNVPDGNMHQMLLRYPNVKIRRINLTRYTKNTPLEEWYKSDPLHKSNFAVSHTSDVLRFLSLWKYGGLYLDLDVVILKNTDDLESNYAGAESKLDVAAGVLKFDPDGFGHRIAEACLRDLRSNFNGNSWGGNGPGVITRVLRRQCNTKNAEVMNRQRCKGFMVYKPEIFYPISFKKWKWYMVHDHLNAVRKMTKNSYAIHVWNKFSFKTKLPKKSKAPYTEFAAKLCPNVFTNLKGTF